MKKYLLLFFLLPLTCLSQTLQWAKQIEGQGYDYGTAIALDAAGNIYLAGDFEDTTDFDPGPGVYNLVAPGWYSDAFVAKYDASGNFTWAKKLGGSDLDQSHAIAVDASGNVYTAGSFYGTADFNPGFGTYNLTAAGDDIFISKLDASGNFVWAVQAGGPGTDVAYGLALDSAGNIYATGNFAGTADFDPGANSYNLTAIGSDVFTWKLDPNGNLVWAKQQGGDASIEIGYAITIDDQDNVYTTGVFGDTADFDPGAGTYNLIQNGNAGLVDGFISKLDVNGNFIWANAIEGPGGMSWSYAIAVDSLYNVFTTGVFQGTCDFDGGNGSYMLNSNNGLNDIYVRKEDPSGNFLWARQIGGSSHYDTGNGIKVDAYGYVYVTGYFSGTVDFNPNAGVFPLSSVGGVEDIYVCILSTNGGFATAFAFYGFATDRGFALALDNAQNIYVTGGFNATVDFDPGAGTANLNSVYGFDGFFMKMGALTTGANAILPVGMNMDIYPNPAEGIFMVQCKEEINKVEISNTLGEIVLTSEGKSFSQQFDLSDQPAGIYFVTVQTENNSVTSKMIIR
jgi:hypothetical protein